MNDKQNYEKLRKKAEAILQSKNYRPDNAPDDMASLLEELSIHQIELEMQNDELRKSQQSLQKEKEKYQQLYDHASVAYITLNRTGNILDLNHAAARLFGKPRELFNFNSIFPFLHEDSKTVFRKLLQDALQLQNQSAGEITFLKDDDTVVYTKVNSQAYEESETGEQIVRLTITDIVEEKTRHLEALKDQEIKFSELFNNSKDAIYLFELNKKERPGNFIEVNRQACEMMDFTYNELLDMSPADIHLNQNLNYLKRAAKELKKYNEARFEMLHVSASGENIPVEIDTHTFVIRGRQLGLAVVRDITERKAYENQIRESERKYRLLAENINDTILLTDLDFNLHYVSPSVQQLTGYTQEEYSQLTLDESMPETSQQIFIKERKKIKSLIEKGEVDFKNYHHSMTLDRYDKNGNLINMEVSQSFLIENGKPKGIITVARDITKRKQAEDRIKETNTRLQMAMEVGNLGWWDWDFENNKLITADKKPEMLGYDPQNDHLTAYDYIGLIHPEDYEKAMDAMRSHLEGKAESYETEYRLRQKNGAYKWLFDKGRIVERAKDGKPRRLMGVVYDISERKYQENQILKREQNLQVLLANLDDIVLEQDKDGTFLNIWTNKPDNLFADADQIIGHKPDDIFPAEFAKFQISALNEALENNASITKTYKSYLSQEDIYYSARITPVRDKMTGDVHLVSLIRNITNRKKNELLIKKQNEELKELNITKDKFFSIIAHDLKNPFNTIIGFSNELLKNHSKLDDEARENLIRSVHESAKQNYSLLENLLVWSRMQSNRMPFNPERITMRELIAENMALYGQTAEKKGVELKVNDKGEEQCWVNADREMINTVIRNLVSNAIKYTPKGGKIYLGCELVGNNAVRVYVKDTGIGMKQETVPKLFEIEETFTTPGTAKEQGTGLGLILVKEFIDKNNGDIQVESQKGEGTTISFTLKSVEAENKCKQNCFGSFDALYSNLKKNPVALKILLDDIALHHKECYKSYSSRKVMAFSDMVMQFAKQYQLNKFEQFASKIKTSMKNFDVNQLNICFGEFDKLLTFLQKQDREN